MNLRVTHRESPACRLGQSQPCSLQDPLSLSPRGAGEGRDERKVKVSASLDGLFPPPPPLSPPPFFLPPRCHGDQNKASLSPLFWIVNGPFSMVPLLIVASPSQDEDLGLLKTGKRVKNKLGWGGGAPWPGGGGRGEED